MAGGILLSFVPGGLVILPLLLTGFLVGEAVSAASRRRGGRELAILAFLCAVLGPIVGRAAFTTVLLLLSQGGARAGLAVIGAYQSFGAFGILLLVLAGIIASTRVDR